MDKRTAQRLAKRIEREAPTVRVNGLAMHGESRSYSLPCTDTVSGYGFWVHSPEAWDERRKEAALYA